MADLDKLLDQLSKEAAGKDLTPLEAEVWARIDAEGSQNNDLSGFGAGPVQLLRSPALAIISALLIGALIGATSLQGAQSAGPMGAFSASAPYAPSTLLGGARQ